MLNQILQADPSRTVTLRKRFMRDGDSRLRMVRRLIAGAINTKDVFGLKVVALIRANIGPERTYAQLLATIEARAFQFDRSARKVERFMDWLEQMEAETVLEIVRRPFAVRMGTGAWSDVYVQSTYQKAILDAHRKLMGEGMDLPEMNADAALRAMFEQPIHADRLGLLFTRTYNELKGVTRTMDQQISRALTQGLAEGKNPNRIAREAVKVVDNVGIVRMRMIARTEVMRSHNEAGLNEYERWGIKKAQILNGANPCPICVDLGGTIVTLAEARTLLPVHPNCTCTHVPIVPKLTRKRRRR